MLLGVIIMARSQRISFMASILNGNGANVTRYQPNLESLQLHGSPHSAAQAAQMLAIAWCLLVARIVVYRLRLLRALSSEPLQGLDLSLFQFLPPPAALAPAARNIVSLVVWLAGKISPDSASARIIRHRYGGNVEARLSSRQQPEQ